MAKEHTQASAGRTFNLPGTGLMSAARGLTVANIIGDDGSTRMEHIAARDRYYVDPAMVPEGCVVEWKRISTLGEPDGKNIQDMMHAKWQPYPADMWIERGGVVGFNTGQNTIEDGNGNVLMVRAAKFSEAAKAEIYEQSVAQLRNYDKMAGGELNKAIGYDKKDSVKADVQTYNRQGAIPVPE